MAIANYDQLVAALPNAKPGLFSKTGPSTQLAGALSSFWLSPGVPGTGVIPGAWATCNDQTLGGWPFDNPTAPALSYISNFSCSGSASHYLLLYDRIGHMGGLVANVNTVQSVNSLALPSNRGIATDFRDIEWFVEVYSAIGTTATNLNINYLDQNDQSRAAPAIAFGGASPANQPSRLYKIIPNPGQNIKAIQTLNLTATTGVAGNFGITCARRVLRASMGQPVIGVGLPFSAIGLPRVYDDACLWLTALLSNATAGTLRADFDLVQA